MVSVPKIHKPCAWFEVCVPRCQFIVFSAASHVSHEQWKSGPWQYAPFSPTKAIQTCCQNLDQRLSSYLAFFVDIILCDFLFDGQYYVCKLIMIRYVMLYIISKMTICGKVCFDARLHIIRQVSWSRTEKPWYKAGSHSHTMSHRRAGHVETLLLSHL